jgi:hypothetical protein
MRADLGRAIHEPCRYCGEVIFDKKELSFDVKDPRKPPVYKGNVQIICKDCNTRKQARTSKEWEEYLWYRKLRAQELNNRSDWKIDDRPDRLYRWIKRRGGSVSVMQIGRSGICGCRSINDAYEIVQRHLIDRGLAEMKTSKNPRNGLQEKAFKMQAHGLKSGPIAEIFNRENLKTGHGNKWDKAKIDRLLKYKRKDFPSQDIVVLREKDGEQRQD